MPDQTQQSCQIANAQINWGQDSSILNKTQDFNFDPVLKQSPAVIVNRSGPKTKSILPVTDANTDLFQIRRNDGISGIETFWWLAISQNNSSGTSPKSSSVLGGSTQIIKWGLATSTKDGDEKFYFPTAFKDKCLLVITNRKGSGTESTLPVSENYKDGFTINRNDNIDGKQDFFWIAVGDVAPSAKDNSCAEIALTPDTTDKANKTTYGYKLKVGVAYSTSDNAQQFTFTDYGLTPFNDCSCVVTNRNDKDSKNILPVTAIGSTAFSITRNEDVDGSVRFFWLAIGN